MSLFIDGSSDLEPYVVIHTKKNGRVELTEHQWLYVDRDSEDDLHREDGPALEFSNGTNYWYQDGEAHRIDGPAVESKGDMYWYIEGEVYLKEGYDKLIQEVRDMPEVLRLVDPRRWVREFK